MTTWYSSDTHFGHERIVELCDRPFASVQEMNDVLVYNWNAVVRPGDWVYVLGDVAIGRAGLAHVARLNGEKVLVAGNHDSCWEYHKRWRREVERYREAGFRSVVSTGFLHHHRLGADGPFVNLAHLPYRGAGDHTVTERYGEQRLEDDGRTLICGHVHEAWRVRRTQAGTLMINVGVDVHQFAPVAAETLIGMAKEAAHG